jgi:hypothetical protein
MLKFLKNKTNELAINLPKKVLLSVSLITFVCLTVFPFLKTDTELVHMLITIRYFYSKAMGDTFSVN